MLGQITGILSERRLCIPVSCHLNHSLNRFHGERILPHSPEPSRSLDAAPRSTDVQMVVESVRQRLLCFVVFVLNGLMASVAR